MKKIIFSFLFAAFITGNAAASEIEDVAGKLKDGDFSVIQTKLIPLAMQGDARAQYNLGVAYLHGDGVPQDAEKAFYWTKKSASQGFGRAEVNLAGLYQAGTGTKQNFGRALYWYEAAAKHDPEVAENAARQADLLKRFLSAKSSKMTASLKAKPQHN